jgi:hypothetical protein
MRSFPWAPTYPVGTGVGLQPLWEGICCLDEQEVTVRVPDSDGDRWEAAGDAHEKEDDEPLILDVVAKA